MRSEHVLADSPDPLLLDCSATKSLIMQADLIMLGSNNNVQIERCSKPPAYKFPTATSGDLIFRRSSK